MYIHPNLEITDIKKNYETQNLNQQNCSGFEKRLFSIMEHKQLTVIHGCIGIGKTTFLHQIKKYFLNISNEQTYTILINVQQLNLLNVQVVLNKLKESQTFLNLISNDQLKENIIQGKVKIIVLFDQFEEILIKQKIQEIMQILKIFINEFKFCIFLTLYTDFLEQICLQDFENQLIIKILTLENYQVEEYFTKTQVNYLEEKINQMLRLNNQNSIDCQVYENFNYQFKKILLDRSEIDIVSQWLKVFCNNISSNEDDSQQFHQAILICLSQKPNLQYFMQKLERFNLKTLALVLEMLNIIIQIIFHGNTRTNQYEFYESFINKLIEYRKSKQQDLQQDFLLDEVITELELIAVEIKFAQQNQYKVNEQYINQTFIWKNSLMKHQQLVHFLVSQYFVKQVSKLAEEYTHLNQIYIDWWRITLFDEMRCKTKLSLFDFSQEKSLEILNFLRDKYNFNEAEQFKLITLIQVSAKYDNFDKVAGNAMMVLSYIQTVINYIDFQGIKVKNSSMNNI